MIGRPDADSIKSCGELTAPPQRMISRSAQSRRITTGVNTIPEFSPHPQSRTGY